MRNNLLFLAAVTSMLSMSNSMAQTENKTQAQTQATDSKASNMMLNAASDDGKPRDINIGLPSDIATTGMMENGFAASYDQQSQFGNTVWRQDGSFSKVQSISLWENAIKNGTVGVAVNTLSGRGQEQTKGAVGYQTNTFGLIRANAKIGGALSKKNGLYYQLSGFANLDPGTQRAQFSRFTDKTFIFRGFLNKKYNAGQIGVQYKFAYSAVCAQWNNNPYIYHEDGTVSEYNGLAIGTTSYIEKTGEAHPYDPFTGKQKTVDILDAMASKSHVIDILGDHKWGNGMKLDYMARLHMAESGFCNPNYGTVFTSNISSVTDRYVYVSDPTQVYNGAIQKGQMAFSEAWDKLGFAARAELSQTIGKHSWYAGLTAFGLDAKDAYRSVYATYATIENNPSALIHQKSTDGGLTWTNGTSDAYGCENPNSALQYYDGLDSKFAFYLGDTWKLHKKFTLSLAARLQWSHIDGFWAPAAGRVKVSDPGVNYKISTINKDAREAFTDDDLQKSFVGNAVWNAFPGGGFSVDAMYVETGINLSSFAQQTKSQVQGSKVNALSAGIFYKNKYIDVTSKINYISRDKNLFSGNFEHPEDRTIIERAVINYDVKTLGWTTDMNIKPFKGFNLHFLLTLQNPEYGDFKFTIGESVNKPYTFDFTGLTVRNVSKCLIEIDPSYKFSKFRVWGSARYYSKSYACFSNALYFASRWETFAGIDYNPTKNITFNLQAVNLLGETGAKGNISGANTISKEEANKYYDQPLAGTFLRPFTIELKTTIRF